ncbi:MAG: hypothetical protein HC862_24305 [Scytonema sp. RU_4_4]|nr:hypothetical protein [Scytonema sp. RU_4_4]
MAEYTIVVIVLNYGNKEISYSVQLIGAFEDYPEDYFGLEENRSNLQTSLQLKTARKISEAQLNQVIHEWIRDIKEGLHRTTLRLELSSEVIPIHQETGVTEIDNPESTIPSKFPRRKNPVKKTQEPKEEKENISTKNTGDF